MSMDVSPILLLSKTSLKNPVRKKSHLYTANFSFKSFSYLQTVGAMPAVEM